MIVLDTTILVYAVGHDHGLREPCRGLLKLVQDGDVRATTTVKVIQEFTHVRARRRSRADAADLARSYAEGLGPLLCPEDEDLLEGLELFRSSKTLGAFDAVLAAAARRRGWVLASADKAFARVRGLEYINPISPTFVEEAASVG